VECGIKGLIADINIMKKPIMKRTIKTNITVFHNTLISKSHVIEQKLYFMSLYRICKETSV